MFKLIACNVFWREACLAIAGSPHVINGEWNPDDFLIAKPGQKTAGVYDWEEIIRAREDTDES